MQVAFYKGRKRLSSRLVSWWLGGVYSHCELILKVDPEGVSHCASASFLDGGVRLKLMRLDPAHWDVLPVGGDPSYAYAWLLEHEEESYDILGLLGFAWRRQQGAQNRWFCSEAVAAMLGWPNPWRLDPMSLWAAMAGNQK